MFYKKSSTTFVLRFFFLSCYISMNYSRNFLLVKKKVIRRYHTPQRLTRLEEIAKDLKVERSVHTPRLVFVKQTVNSSWVVDTSRLRCIYTFNLGIGIVVRSIRPKFYPHTYVQRKLWCIYPTYVQSFELKYKVTNRVCRLRKLATTYKLVLSFRCSREYGSHDHTLDLSF